MLRIISAAAREQDRGQRQLKHHQTVRPATAADCSRSGAASLHEYVGDSWLRRLQRRHETEEQRGGETHTCREREHPFVHREADPVGKATLASTERAGDHANRRQRKPPAGGARQRREQETLDEQLPDDLCAAGADRHADRYLVRPHGRTREQQICHIRARHQQHECDDAHQHWKRGPTPAADGPLTIRGHDRCDVAIRLRILLRERSGDRRSSRRRPARC